MTCVRTRAAILCLTVAFGVSASERPGNWTGHYYACDGHAELFKPGHMSLGVRFATSKARVATAFARAMSFWALRRSPELTHRYSPKVTQAF